MTRMSSLISALLMAGLLPVLAAPSAAAAQTPQSWYGDQGFVAPDGIRIVACHGYGCARRMEMSMDGALMSRVEAALRAGRGSPAAERRALSEAIRAYTAYLAASFGGDPDLPRSPPQWSGVFGQMDCVDETTNTTSLLLVLQEQGLLAHHRVERPQSRGLFIDGRYPPVTAVVAEKRTGREWAVDPWTRAPGQQPDILPLDRWRQES
jgi:hypothetical protein